MGMGIYMCQKEFAARPRRKWFYLKRTGFVGLGALILLWSLLVGALTRTTTLGLQIFQSLSMTVLFFACVLSVLAAGLSIVQEKTNRTLGVLFLTDVPAWQIVTGKLWATITFTTLTMMSILPMLLLSVTLGGISIVQILAALAVLLTTIFLGTCIGLSVSTVARRERHLFGVAVLTCSLIFVLLPLGVGFLCPWRGWNPKVVLPFVSPFRAISWIGQGAPPGVALTNCLFNIAVGLPLLGIACWLLPRGLFPQHKTLPFVRKRQPGSAGRSVAPAIKGNPVHWRDRHFTYGGPRQEWVSCALVVLATAVIGFIIFGFTTGGDVLFSLVGALGAVSAVCGGVFGLAAVFRASRAFNTEKLGGTMDGLLMSELTDKQIIRGKIVAVWHSVRPWFIISACCGVAASFSTGSFAVPVITAVQYLARAWLAVFVIVCVALWFSLYFRTPAALGLCFLTFILWNSCAKSTLSMPFMFLFSFIGMASASLGEELTMTIMLTVMAIPTLLLDLAAGLLLLHYLQNNFRQRALKEM